LKSNIVKVRTYKGKGTGILYPCKYSKTENGYSSYLVFTCAHVLNLENIELPADGQNIKGLVELEIFDDTGSLVDESDIKEILYHIPQNPEDDLCDIAVFLIQIKSIIRISLELKIYQNEIKNRELLYVEGYPRVMLNDRINQKVQLEGMYKELFPERPMVGMYQIRDDYHWYNDFQDLKLMEGFSGSPVYIEKNDGTYLLGMNQSVANIRKGENPFKIVYYLKMQYILDCLRQSNCIIFRLSKDGSVDIEWVLDQEQEGKNISILMVGDSGAGKSSFTKTFAYHGNKIKTTNDGQTTRSNVFYQFSLFPEKCCVKVDFFLKKEFQEKIREKLSIQKWLCFLEDIAEIDGAKADYTGCAFLKNIYPFFRQMKKSGVVTKDPKYQKYREKIRIEAQKIEIAISDILVEPFAREEISTKDYFQRLNDCYDLVIGFLWKRIPMRYWKECFDINSWQQISKAGKLDVASDDKYISIIRQFTKDKVVWKDYQETLAQRLFEILSCIGGNTRETFFGEKFEKLCYSLLHIEGFFDLKEIDFLSIQEKGGWIELMNADVEKRCNAIYAIENEEEKDDNKQKMCTIQRHLNQICNYLYGVLYDGFSECIKEKHLVFDLEQVIDTEDEDLLQKCFQSTQNGSLTVFVRKILVEDKISDQYAWNIRRLHIKKLGILDSCGLDHIKNNVDDVSKIRNILTEYNESMNTTSITGEENFAVVYLKKLDSGKPDELRNILPAIVRAIPGAPIYCVFSGIDIFYNQNDIYLQNLVWNEQNIKNVPKSVRYLLMDTDSNELETKKSQIAVKADMLFGGTGISDIRKHNLYIVLKNNLIPFCGNRALLQKNFNFRESNQKYIEKLLASILIDEAGSMEIIQMDEGKLEDATDCIKDIVQLIFEKATVKKWHSIHHMIRRADYYRLSDPKESVLGYYSYVADIRLRWYQLFSDAYYDVISTASKTQEFIRIFQKKDWAAIESVLIHMGDRYLFGNEYYFNQKEFNKNQTEFRQALQSLYPEGDSYTPAIQKNDAHRKNKKATAEEIEKYLRESTNFLDRYQKSNQSDKFCEIFKNAFRRQIHDENGAKAESLIRINEEFETALHNLEILFEMRYDDKNLLYMTIKEYLSMKTKRE
jgi:GTPase SAR1 family protein